MANIVDLRTPDVIDLRSSSEYVPNDDSPAYYPNSEPSSSSSDREYGDHFYNDEANYYFNQGQDYDYENSPPYIPPESSSSSSTQKRKAKNTMRRFLKRQILKRNIKSRRIKKIKVIQKLSRRNKYSRLASYLKKVCDDSGSCIALGKEYETIKEMFGGFTYFFYVKDPVKRIGHPSANGFVHEIKYTRHGYHAYAVLKSSRDQDSDNLMYEYRVGLFLNKMSKFFPNFVETYGVYKYGDRDKYRMMRDNVEIDAKKFRSLVDINMNTNPEPLIRAIKKYDLKVACTDSNYIAILIQHLKNCTPFRDFLRNNVIIHHEFFQILYQVYFTLNAMKTIFTHYDLHAYNVLLYKPSETKYIQYHYQTPAGVVEFKSVYIAKIIDYGRCHFNDIDAANPLNSYSSENVHNELCAINECNTNYVHQCGVGLGFKYIDGTRHHIKSRVKNESHDLRLFDIVFDVAQNKSHHQSQQFNDAMDNIDQIVYDENYGTKEIVNCQPNELCNVTTALENVERAVISVRHDNDLVYTGEKLGDMYVYSDGRHMQFIYS